MCKLSDSELLLLEKGQLTCEDIDAALGDYVEKELSKTVSDRIDTHLSSCEACQEGVKLYKEVISLAGTLDSSLLGVDCIDEQHLNPHQLCEWDVEEDTSMPSDIKDRLHAKLNRQLGLSLGRR